MFNVIYGLIILILAGVIIYFIVESARQTSNVPIQATSVTYWWIPSTPWNPWPHGWRPWRPIPPGPGPRPFPPPPSQRPLGPGGEQHLLGPGGEKRMFGGSAPEPFRNMRS